MSENVSVTLLVKTIGRKKGDVIVVDQATADRLVASHGARLTPAAPAPEPKPDTVEAILAEVGEDQAAAVAALELENAKGDKARSSLVAKLEAIASKSVEG